MFVKLRQKAILTKMDSQSDREQNFKSSRNSKVYVKANFKKGEISEKSLFSSEKAIQAIIENSLTMGRKTLALTAMFTLHGRKPGYPKGFVGQYFKRHTLWTQC